MRVAWSSLVMLALAASAARAAEPAIRDRAGFFSPPVVALQEQTIGQIAQQYQKSLVIQTLTELPADARSRLESQGKETFWPQWTQEARARVNANIYVLICRNPGHTEVVVDSETAKKAFTPADAQQLKKVIENELTRQQQDEGLRLGLKFVRERLAATASSGTNWLLVGGWTCMSSAVAILLVLWIAARIYARRSYRRGYVPGYLRPGMGAGLSGDSLSGEPAAGGVRRVVGGVLGVLLGEWAHDRIVGPSGPQIPPSPPPAEPAAESGPFFVEQDDVPEEVHEPAPEPPAGSAEPDDNGDTA